MVVRLCVLVCFVFLLNWDSVRIISATPILPKEVGDGVVGPGEILLEVFGRPFAPVSPSSVTSQCRAHSGIYLEALESFSPWALNMYDASTKIPSGIITGNIQQLGNYEQCVKIVSGNSRAFKGQHCTASVQFAIDEPGKSSRSSSLDMKDLLLGVAEAAGMRNWTGPTTALYKWSFCVPATCTPSDVEAALDEKLRPLNNPGRVEVMVRVGSDQCLTEDQEDHSLEPSDLAIICVFAFFALFLISSTTFDLVVYRKASSKYGKNKRRDAVLLSFSLYTNGKNLMDTERSKDTLKCMDGIRFLTLCWVIFGHTYYMNSVKPQLNSSDVQYFRYDWTKMVVMNGTLCTDTFFLLSGVLLSYVFLRQMAKNPRFNIAKFYLHRYLRLTPPLAMVVFFYATLFYNLGSGPQWNTWVGTNRDYCVDNWWTNLLYVNNYIDVGRMCMDHTWYLAVDMQLLWLSPLVIYPLWRWARFGKVVWGVALAATVVAPFVITYTRGLAGALLYATDVAMLGNVYVNVYIRTYNRGGPYLVGIALGYILHATRGKTLTMPRVGVALGWLCSALLCLVTLFGVYPMYQPLHVYSPLEASSYAALYRSVWALGVAWVVFACVHGHGGIVNALLSWKVFLPLSRLSYSSYLCHFMVLLYNAGSARSPGYLRNYDVVREFLGNTLITLFLATIIYLTFEVPFMVLDRALLSREKQLACPKQDGVVNEDANKVNFEMNPDMFRGDFTSSEHLKTAVCTGYDNEAFQGISTY